MKTSDLMEIFSEKSYARLYELVKKLRFVFLLILTAYLIVCLISLTIHIIQTVIHTHLDLPFNTMRNILSEALFVLIILDFTTAMFYLKRIHYILTILEIGFIVVTRKLILLNPEPQNAVLIFTLSIAAMGFFILIMYFYKITDRLRKGN
jgi:uncharacterized membrane protein (DUF373 family)